ncbi:PhaR [Kurthia massiliensis]|uniref:PhaR n=1 Tax=Kurthia massiliensis TaxID=1033739 RepID=UPI000289BDE0|nr:PhaR [Kurthia massiliensis]
MTNQTFDAFSIWKDLYDRTESAFRDSIQSTLEQPAFAEGLGQIQKQYLQYQGLVNGMTESYLKQVNVPTRDEIASIASLVINVESKIIDLEDQLDDIDTAHETNSKEIKQLKTSVSKLDKKLDTVIELLTKQVEATAKPAPVTVPAADIKVQTAASTAKATPKTQPKK